MIFDLDGTLFQTETLLVPAYERTFESLKQDGLYQGDTPPVDIMIGALGNLLEHIWQQVIPGASKELVQQADQRLLQFQIDGLKQGEGELYPEVKTVLSQLKAEGIRLFVASNGLEGYVKGVVKYKELEPLFEGLYSAGEYRTSSKVQLVEQLLSRHQIESAWMVGDRSSDVEAGLKNGLPVVGCGYAGFGKDTELTNASVMINRFSQLLELYA
ncbi:HAD family hydrolase [Marinicrinis lubricantis]|uniref:HAD family hydrolase n=1 Tax=Marinicrinis lubricantis TaxID=2086470 RepID=A0ABW1IH04_9BACL